MATPHPGGPSPAAGVLDSLRQVEARLALRPGEPGLWRAKADLLRGMGEVPLARQAFDRSLELDPDQAEVLLDRAVMGLTHGDPVEAMLALLERCLRLRPRMEGALYWTAYAHLLLEEFVAAAQHLGRAVEAAPDNPHYHFMLGWTWGRAGDGAASGRAFMRMAEMCMSAYDQSRDMTYLGHLIHALFAAGLDSEARRLLKHFTDRRAGRGPSFHQPGYLPDTPTRIRILRRLVGGRDLAIMTYGPSIATLREEIGRLAGADICYFTFNEPVVDKNILTKIGRASDLFCVTSPQVLGENLPWLLEFMDRPQESMLFTHQGALQGLEARGVSPDWLHARHAERLFCLRSMQRHPPVPSDPLHFPPYNTLSVVLPLAVLARPRRIFLFGCDGRLSARSDPKSAMFYSDDFQADRFAKTKRKQDEATYNQWMSGYDRWLTLDTHQFNFQVGVSLAWLSHLFEVDIPPIYNCSPASAYEGFPKITYQECFAMLERPSLRVPLSAAGAGEGRVVSPR